MAELDRWLKALGEEAAYGAEAAGRLEARLAGEPAPGVSARRRGLAVSVAFAGVAMVAGAAMGAVFEIAQAPTLSAMLPASQEGTAAGLFFGGEG